MVIKAILVFLFSAAAGAECSRIIDCYKLYKKTKNKDYKIKIILALVVALVMASLAVFSILCFF